MKATRNHRQAADEFLTTTPDQETWRVFRIMSEFVEGFETMKGTSPAVSVFGSARMAEDDPFYGICVQTTRKLAEHGFTIITGGGPGAMAAANKGAQLGGSTSIGLNIELPEEQDPNEFQDISLFFRYFFARKVMFVKYAMAFLILPGGYGTLDEVFEALTLIQTKKVKHFPVILMGEQYWGGLLTWLRETMVREGKIEETDMGLITCTDDPDEVLRIVNREWEDTRASVARTT